MRAPEAFKTSIIKRHLVPSLSRASIVVAIAQTTPSRAVDAEGDLRRASIIAFARVHARSIVDAPNACSCLKANLALM